MCTLSSVASQAAAGTDDVMSPDDDAGVCDRAHCACCSLLVRCACQRAYT